MLHTITRLGLLAYFSLVLTALFFLGNSLETLRTTAYDLHRDTQIILTDINTNFPELAEEFNAIEPATGQ